MRPIHYECRPEECLLHNLGASQHLEQHHNGSGGICQLLENESNLLGWIDEDPNALHHPYYNKLYKKAKPDKFGLICCDDISKNNRLIIVKPKLEDWIISISKSSKIDLAEYGLSDDADELHKTINFKIGDFQRLLHQLLKAKSPALLHAKKLLGIQ